MIQKWLLANFEMKTQKPEYIIQITTYEHSQIRKET